MQGGGGRGVVLSVTAGGEGMGVGVAGVQVRRGRFGAWGPSLLCEPDEGGGRRRVGCGHPIFPSVGGDGGA